MLDLHDPRQVKSTDLALRNLHDALRGTCTFSRAIRIVRDD